MSNSSHDTANLIVLAGNPNVGKSSVFNALTGLRHHTGNWPGKTVDSSLGHCTFKGEDYIIADIPGTYSLAAHSQEEEVARDFIVFENISSVIIVCDAACLERNLNLVLQTTEITDNVIVCVNLLDEAKKRGISVNLKKLSQKLGVPVIGTIAKSGKGVDKLMDAVARGTNGTHPLRASYTRPIEDALDLLTPLISEKLTEKIKFKPRWLALKLLENDSELLSRISEHICLDLTKDEEIQKALSQCRKLLSESGTEDSGKLSDIVASCLILSAEDVTNGVVSGKEKSYSPRDRKIDKIITSRIFGFPLMALLLAIVFWLTVSGANFPSELLLKCCSVLEDILLTACITHNVPEVIYSPLILGVYNILTRVIAVMLPPMAIFFPLFTLLEDLGYLPRIAFNLDNCLKKCSACGKQALTMCMGFGCNAAGVVGCRIIDSPRERLIAILTNSFVPCNGKFPTLISIITMFFVCYSSGISSSIFGALMLTAVVLFGIFATFAASLFLSKTFLKGQPSSFTLELPPYRRPNILQIIVRSCLDRTLFVLSRAACVAAPAGLVIWLFANIRIGGASFLAHTSAFLDPVGRLIGMDGTILLAFILGFPANETVIPIIIMSYISSAAPGSEMALYEMKELFIANGWTQITAINVMLFSLMHWPCSTTLLTVKKETGSLKWTLAAAALPTCAGFITCFIFTQIVRFIL